MIENLQMVANETQILTYEYDGKPGEVLFSDLAPYYIFSEQKYFKRGNCSVDPIFQEVIRFTMITDDKSSVVAEWDAEEKHFCHISGAIGAIDAIYGNDGYLYVLEDRSNIIFGKSYVLSRVRCCTMDVYEMGTDLKCTFPEDISEDEENPLYLERDGGRILLINGDEEYTLIESLYELDNN